MTNREAILRLSINTGDTLAITSLHRNNADVIRGAVTRYFGEGPVAEKAAARKSGRMVCELCQPGMRSDA